MVRWTGTETVIDDRIEKVRRVRRARMRGRLTSRTDV